MTGMKSILKGIAGLAAAVVAFIPGCSTTPATHEGGVPVAQPEPEINQEMSDKSGNSDVSEPQEAVMDHSNEVLDVYGPPPEDLDDPEINEEILEEAAEKEEAEKGIESPVEEATEEKVEEATEEKIVEKPAEPKKVRPIDDSRFVTYYGPPARFQRQTK